MDNPALCRVCLAGGIRMHHVTSSELQEVFEKLSNTKLDAAYARVTMLCYMCYAQLQKCHRFWRAARRSDSILAQMYQGGVVYSEDMLTYERPQVHIYSVSPIENVNIFSNDNVIEVEEFKALKLETVENVCEDGIEDVVKDTQTDVKLDPDCESTSNTDCNAPIPETDSEDDVPLNTLKCLKKVKVEGQRQKRKYNKRIKLDVRVLTLTKEQQLLDVLSRATSHNYLHSPYRCELCYRGFVSQAAFANHQEKHDERSGAHVCDICKMRYRSARLLRTHARAAHAQRYACNKCGHHAHTKHQASDHERWHNGHTYECQLCSQNFVARTSYLTHVRLRHAPRHACAACGERFLGAHGLRMHGAKAHRGGEEPETASPPLPHHCSRCGVTFASRRAWETHLLTADENHVHTKECPICSVVIEGAVRDHMREHERRLRPAPPPPPHRPALTCDQCGQTFPTRSSLASHSRRVHLGLTYRKEIVCEVCGRKCTSNAALKYHQRTHTGERPHACACGARFADGARLRVHRRTHTGERPYACHRCGKRFAQKPALNRHYRVHTGAKPYTCELCSKSFSQSNSLKVHVRAVHLKMPSYKRKQANTVGKSGTDINVGGNNASDGGNNVSVGGTNVVGATGVVGGTNVVGGAVGVGGTGVVGDTGVGKSVVIRSGDMKTDQDLTK